MQAEKAQGDKGTAGQEGSSHTASTAASPAVQGVPWWGGVGHQQALQTACSSPGRSLHMEHPGAAATSIRPLGFVHPHTMQQTQVLAPTLPEDFGNGANDENQPQAGAPAVLQSAVREYILPHTQLELGHSMAPAVYSYADPYFGGMVATYGAQAMIYPHMLGIHQSRMPLPTEITEEEPVYVNAKQYNGIMRRRQSRAKAESENKLVKSRKPYLHESRHLHAMRRARGCGGRFLNKAADDSKANSDSTRSSEGQSSQEGTTPDSKKPGRMDPGLKSCAMHTVRGMADGSMRQSINGASYSPGMLNHGNHSMVQGDQNQTVHVSAFHLNPGVADEGDSGQSGGIMAKSSQQRAIAMQ